MTTYKSKTFKQLYDRGGGIYSNLNIHDCNFDNCGISLVSKIDQRSVATKLNISDCSMLNCAIGPLLLSDSNICDLKTGDIQIFWGTVFERVKLIGKFGRIKINNRIHDPYATQNEQQSFDSNRIELYKKIDWALDIREMKASLFMIEGVPAQNILHNKDTAIALKHSEQNKTLNEIVKQDTTPKDWGYLISDFINDKTANELFLVAPLGKSKKSLAPYLNLISSLRSLAPQNCV